MVLLPKIREIFRRKRNFKGAKKGSTIFWGKERGWELALF